MKFKDEAEYYTLTYSHMHPTNTQYGYLTLFSLLCPAAPLLVLLVQYVQCHLNSAHLARCRRPAITKR